jgi:hypothetical protein
MNDMVFERGFACVDGNQVDWPDRPVEVRQLDRDALWLIRILMDKHRRAEFLAGQVERYVREHGHAPTYGQLEERLSFDIDGETIRLFSRSTIRRAILRWKNASRPSRDSPVCPTFSISGSAGRVGTSSDPLEFAMVCHVTQEISIG